MNIYQIEVHGEPATAIQYLNNEPPPEAKLCSITKTEHGNELTPLPDNTHPIETHILGVPTINGWKPLHDTDWYVTEHNGTQHIINNETFHFVFAIQLINQYQSTFT